LPNSLAERFTKQPALELRPSHDEGAANSAKLQEAVGPLIRATPLISQQGFYC